MSWFQLSALCFGVFRLRIPNKHSDSSPVGPKGSALQECRVKDERSVPADSYSHNQVLLVKSQKVDKAAKKAFDHGVSKILNPRTLTPQTLNPKP